jgi:UDP-N-acetylglucosamine--N-acetylmuramyl-(pentapeptide) pyrophosphoryl-undecaprenol N-acetylglucosamine transferase
MERRVSELASPRVSETNLRVMIAGGGTGGHVVPALAIGRELRDVYGAEVWFVGTARGLETRLVPEAGFRLELVRSGQLKNVSLATRLRTMMDLPLGVLRCVSLLREFKPQVVVGVGGYASGPAMIAALLLRIPTLAYEPNAVPGMTNRVVGKRVSAAAVNFGQTAKYFRNAEVTGVPVRPAIFTLPQRLVGAMPRLLVTAGSNGALVFNETMPLIVARLLEDVPGLTIVHQSGPRALEATRASYTQSGADPARWVVEAFLTDMPEQYAAADVVLARSGSTVAELCAAGKPSLLVPFAGAADDHQRKNAEVLVEAGAAEMLLQRDVTPETLRTALEGLLKDGPRRATMAEKARSLSRPGALQRIAEMVLGLAGPNLSGQKKKG